MPAQPPLSGGELNAAITGAIVGIYTEYTGRGPGSVSTFHHDNVIVSLMHDVLNRAETALAQSDHRANVTTIRALYQETMQSDFTAAIERLTGRKVIAFISGNHAAPDIASEVFTLDGPITTPSSHQARPDAPHVPSPRQDSAPETPAAAVARVPSELAQGSLTQPGDLDLGTADRPVRAFTLLGHSVGNPRGSRRPIAGGHRLSSHPVGADGAGASDRRPRAGRRPPAAAARCRPDPSAARRRAGPAW